MKKVFFRTDGSEQVGLGHIYRCIAFSEAIEGQFKLTFLLKDSASFIPELLHKELHSVDIIQLGSEREENEIEEIKGHLKEADILVIDTYLLSDSYYGLCAKRNIKTIIIDDQLNSRIYGNVLINHIVNVDKSGFNPLNDKVFTGSKYAMIRKDFLSQRTTVDARTRNRIFLYLGGSDNNKINQLIGWLFEYDKNFEVEVLIGKDITDELEELVELYPKKLHLHGAMTPKEIIRTVANCEFTITTPSTISYEIFTIGKPAICGYINSSQTQILEVFENENLAVSAGDFSQDSLLRAITEVREKEDLLVKNQKRMFDRNSHQRIKEIVNLLWLA